MEAQELEVNKVTHMYASFSLKGNEFVLDINAVQEVVNYPESIFSMPLAPDYLDGIFNLRGMIIPILNLAKLLGIADDNGTNDNLKVAIVNIDGISVGVSFDTTGEIIKADHCEVSNFDISDESDESQVVKGAIKRDNGNRIYQILEPSQIIKIRNLARLGSYDAFREGVDTRLKVQARQNKCISFRVNDIPLAIEITSVNEIINMQEIEHSAFSSKLCLGLVNLRGMTIPVLSFSRILGIESSSEVNNDQKILIIKLGSEFFGLIVDSLDAITFYSDDKVMPVPVFSSIRSHMFLGGIEAEENGMTFLIDHSEILNNDEIKQITKSHSEIYQSQKDEEEKEKVARQLESYVTFNFGYHFGLSVSEIREIIEVPKDILKTPGAPSHVLGVHDLREQLITIVNPKKMYGIEESDDELGGKKVIILEADERGENYGILVDEIDSIVKIDMLNKMKMPSLLSNVSGKLNQDVSEIIRDINGSGVVILSFEAIVRRIGMTK
ncbi:chemotaxis protein CheW [Halobacteriovorax sp. DPLXC-1]|uniref:chemotaxis protein CheW n=1 Tax=Halobacteriovorax sp. DPLXC-1 TaxID=3110771 RepID=UPI002FF2BC68